MRLEYALMLALACGFMEALAHAYGVNGQIADIFDLIAGVAFGAWFWRNVE